MSQNSAKGQALNGIAGGDLSGLYPSPIVIGIDGYALSGSGPTSGQILEYNGSNLVWITAASIVTFAGDLSGSNTTQKVIGIDGYAISGPGPTNGQILEYNGSNLVWITPSSGVTFAGDLSGSNTTQKVIGIDGYAISGLGPVSGQILEYNGSNMVWITPSSGVTWANDLSGSTNTDQYIATISGSGGAGGTVTLNIAELQYASGQSAPTYTQAALGSTSGGSGSNGQNIYIIPQAGQAATGSSHNGGNGGFLVLESGAGGTSGSATPGSAGDIYVSPGGTSLLVLSGGTAGNFTWVNTSAVPNFSQTALGSTSGGSGSAGNNTTLTAQAGQAATGAAHNGGAGGLIVIGGGAGGTSGSATAGVSGYVKFTTGSVFPTNTQTSSYTLTYADYHIFANFSSGANLTLPVPINGLTYHVWDISGTAETNNITLVQHSSEKISGVAASRILQTNWGHWTITTNGTDWLVG